MNFQKWPILSQIKFYKIKNIIHFNSFVKIKSNRDNTVVIIIIN